MKRFFPRLIVILSAMTALWGCDRDGKNMSALVASDEIRLQIGGKTQFRYDPLTCQLGFSRDHKQFRAHTDNMSDFFIVDLSEIPSSEGQEVTADFTWTTDKDILTKKNVTLTVEKLEGDKIWLWSSSAHMGFSMRALE